MLQPGRRSQQQWLYVVIVADAAAGVAFAVGVAKGSKEHSLVGVAAKKTATWMRPNSLKPVVVVVASMYWILDSGL